jgi:hypothetical protein
VMPWARRACIELPLALSPSRPVLAPLRNQEYNSLPVLSFVLCCCWLCALRPDALNRSGGRGLTVARVCTVDGRRHAARFVEPKAWEIKSEAGVVVFSSSGLI